MRNQRYGRIVNTTSGSGIYGSFGQLNYSSAKMGLIGFTKTLSKEGKSRNILVNAIAPIAATAMTKTVFQKEILDQISPK